MPPPIPAKMFVLVLPTAAGPRTVKNCPVAIGLPPLKPASVAVFEYGATRTPPIEITSLTACWPFDKVAFPVLTSTTEMTPLLFATISATDRNVVPFFSAIRPTLLATSAPSAANWAAVLPTIRSCAAALAAIEGAVVVALRPPVSAPRPPAANVCSGLYPSGCSPAAIKVVCSTISVATPINPPAKNCAAFPPGSLKFTGSLAAYAYLFVPTPLSVGSSQSGDTNRPISGS